MPSKKTAKLTGNHRTAAIGLIVVCIVGTAILIAARSSEPTAAPVAAETPAPPAPVKTAAIPARAPKATGDAAAKPQAGETAANAAPAEPATIVGCLVQEDETFRLKNTSGDDAPKGRSWKSGFLKKSNKTIPLVDERHRLNLASHVGERVSVSGMLDEHELQGTSLKRVAETCE
jgi:hypothetical protein